MAKLTLLFAVFLLLVAAAAAVPKGKGKGKGKFNKGKGKGTGGKTTVQVPPALTIPTARRDLIRQRLKAAGGCNANVCFAIDGSSNMPASEFVLQKNFVLDVMSVVGVDQPVEMSATMYGDDSYPITPLTVDVEYFNLAVDGTKQSGGKSFTRSGINYCANQLAKRKGEANKLVLLSDGITDKGRNAVRRANRFRNLKQGDLTVVAAGRRDYVQLFAIAGWDNTRIMEVNNFFDVLKLEQALNRLVAVVCDVGGKKRFPWVRPTKFRPQLLAMKQRQKRFKTYCKEHACPWLNDQKN